MYSPILVYFVCSKAHDNSNKKAVLSLGEPRDAAVNFDSYLILQ